MGNTEKEVQALVDAAVAAAVANVRAEFNVASITADMKGANANTVDVVAAKVASFNPDSPEVWFIQLEDQFNLKNIKTQDTKYEYVTSNINRKTATEMAGFLKNRPKTEPYNKIKKKIDPRKTSKTRPGETSMCEGRIC